MANLISIVLPVYNGEKYLEESIDSILAQTYEDWELLIIDDCSTDNSAQIAKEYAAKDTRIHYYKNEENLKLPRTLNKGFSLANGDYLTWTSDDNKYRPTALEKMYNTLISNPDENFVFASCRIINDVGDEIEYIMVSEASKRTIIGTNPVGACFMYTREVYEKLGSYDSELLLVEDFDYWQRIYINYGAIIIEEILYDYRWHEDALTSTMKKDEFNRNLERMLLKNRSGFGKVSAEENYYYYKGLFECRENLKYVDNPYRLKYRWYQAIYLICYRIPRKMLRIFKGI